MGFLRLWYCLGGVLEVFLFVLINTVKQSGEQQKSLTQVLEVEEAE